MSDFTNDELEEYHAFIKGNTDLKEYEIKGVYNRLLASQCFLEEPDLASLVVYYAKDPTTNMIVRRYDLSSLEEEAKKRLFKSIKLKLEGWLNSEKYKSMFEYPAESVSHCFLDNEVSPLGKQYVYYNMGDKGSIKRNYRLPKPADQYIYNANGRILSEMSSLSIGNSINSSLVPTPVEIPIENKITITPPHPEEIPVMSAPESSTTSSTVAETIPLLASVPSVDIQVPVVALPEAPQATPVVIEPTPILTSSPSVETSVPVVVLPETPPIVSSETPSLPEISTMAIPEITSTPPSKDTYRNMDDMYGYINYHKDTFVNLYSM